MSVDCLNNDQMSPDGSSFCGTKKFAPDPEPDDLDIYALRVDQTLTTLRPTGRKNFASVFR